MSLEDLSSAYARPTEDCLSALRVSRFVSGGLTERERLQTAFHLEGCTHCHGRVTEELTQFQAAQLEPLPAWLLAKPGVQNRVASNVVALTPNREADDARDAFTNAVLTRLDRSARPRRSRGRENHPAVRRHRRWALATGAFGTTLFAAAIAMFFVSPGELDRLSPLAVSGQGGLENSSFEGVRLKGHSGLEISVSRAGEVIATDFPAEKLPALKAGDVLRLRARPSARKPWLRVEGAEADGWQLYFEGNPPTDGWLPMGLLVTPEGKTRIRVTWCSNADAATGTCHDTVYEWTPTP